MACRIQPILFAFLLIAQPSLIQAMPVDVDGDGKVGPLELIDLSSSWKSSALAQFWQANGPFIYYNGGNVGISTATPLRKLSTVSIGIFVARFEGTDPIGSVVEFRNTTTDTVWEYAVSGSTSAFNTPPGSAFFYRQGSGAPNIVMTPNGNVGIGTSIATSKLEIVGQDGLGIVGYQPFLTLKDDNAGYARSRIQGVNGNIAFYPDSFIGNYPPVSIFNGSGSLSVGTSSPDPRARLYAVTGGSGEYALKGDAPNGSGVYGTSNSSSGSDAGVVGIGRRDTGAWGGLFIGGVSLEGGLYVIGGIHEYKGRIVSTIDHPLDPVNKYLSHTSVESSELKNFYDGTVVTDASGFAVISLPDWFEALNKDFRYQLTVIGQFAQAIVEEKIHDNRFIVRTDKPNVEVSWQITGVSQDAWTKAHPIEVEKAKSDDDHGNYLAPIEFSQPMKKGLYYSPEDLYSSRPEESTK